MFDVSFHLKKFYDDHVRLGQVRRKQLAEHRDASLKRLSEGRRKLGKPDWADKRDQGSYDMHTLNQQTKNDYDIDVAVIFEADQLPANALDARKQVEAALLEAGGNFRKPPTARTNAVTIWYAEGHHVDLAVYRRSTDWLGRVILEHAGAVWKKRNPQEVSDWFAQKVKGLSPTGQGVQVDEGQIRRIVRFTKAFARSREVWKSLLPGGMIITTLVVEVYCRNTERDDISLYQTLKALKRRLDANTEVRSPVDNSVLTAKAQVAAQVRRFAEKIELALTELAVLEDPDCNEKDALTAWNWVFRHVFWGELRADVDAEPPPDAEQEVRRLEFEVGIANEERGDIKRPYTGHVEPLPKGKWLRMRPKDLLLPKGATLRWTVRNTGDEARRAGQERWTKDTTQELWTSTRYKGVHTICCEAILNGRVIGRGIRRIRIGRG